jgi:hypothetical protein
MESSIVCVVDGSQDPELVLAVVNVARLRRRRGS